MDKEKAYQCIIELQKEQISLLNRFMIPDENKKELIRESFYERIEEIIDEIEEIEKNSFIRR